MMKRTMWADKLLEAPFNVMTNDPSMTAWGWVVVNARDNKIQACGVVKTAPENKKRRIRKGDDTVRRVSEIVKQLVEVIRKYDVSFVVSELPHGSQNASAAMMIGMVTGVMQTITDMMELGIEWYSEQDAKRAMFNRISATKQETIEAMQQLLNFTPYGVKYVDEATADALAVYYCAIQQSPTLKTIRK